MPTPKVNDLVYVRSLGQNGRVIEVPSAGSTKPYVVAIGDLKVKVNLADIEVRKGKASQSVAVKLPKSNDRHARNKDQEIDLHGLRVHEALEKVNQVIDRAIMDDYGSIAFIHGIGDDKLRAAIHKHLPTLSVVRRFCLDSVNRGVTRVYF